MAVMFIIFSAILGRDLLVAADASLAAYRTCDCVRIDLLVADEKIRRRASADILNPGSRLPMYGPLKQLGVPQIIVNSNYF